MPAKLSEGSLRLSRWKPSDLAVWVPTEPLKRLMQEIGVSELELARRAYGTDSRGARRGNVNRNLQAERLSWRLADRYATALGYHPAEIWGFDWTAAA